MDSVDKSYGLIHTLSDAPEQLFDPTGLLTSNIKSNLKDLYDHCKKLEIKSSSSLPELIIENFDNEQIWQQVELQNDSILKDAVVNVSNLLLKKKNLTFSSSENVVTRTNENELSSYEIETLEESESSLQDDSEMEKANELQGSSDQEEDKDEPEIPSNSIKKSIVDDDFFKLHEMNEFLNSEENKLNRDSGNEQDLDESDEKSVESIDLFAEDSVDSEDAKVRLAKYKEFFLSKEEHKKPKRNKYLDEFSDQDESYNQQSTFELRQNRLKQKIEEIEHKVVSEKPWQLQGEIKADSRPQNSLLEEIVEFDRTTRPAPIITGQTTVQLEDIIKQRIKDKVFDSVERKVKPVETLLEYKKKLVLDQEKSKASLAQIYEKEYLDQQIALDPANNAKEEEEPESHKTIKSMMKSLFNQLDALCNFHFTPKAAIPELRIISNIPAINMEEVAPVAISDAALLAPEEVKLKPKADILGKSERTTTDKNRERRKKKLKQRYHAKEKAKREQLVQRANPGMENKYSKEKSRHLLEKVSREGNTEKMVENFERKGIKSSTAFFTQLQHQVQSQIKSKSLSSKKKSIYDAKKMKL